MAYLRTQAQKLLTAAELEMFDAGRTSEIKKLTKPQLRNKLERSRKLRDKYRDLFRRQRLAARDTLGSKSGNRGAANQRTQQKEEIFAESVARFEARLTQMEREEDLAFEKASKADAAATSRAPAKRGTKSAAKKTTARKAASATKTAAPKKSVAKRAKPAAKATPLKAVAAKKAAPKKASPKKAAVKKAAAKSASATSIAREIKSQSARAVSRNRVKQTSRGTDIGAHQRSQTRRSQAKKDSR